MADNAILQTISLTKDYGNGRGAFDINIAVKPGEIVGFLGPNGAGKTTTMRMIMHFAKQNAGEVSIFGKAIDTEADMLELMPDIGFLAGEVNFPAGFTARELFRYAAKLYDKHYDNRMSELAELLDLDLDRKIKYLSLGNKQKVGIIHAVMHFPKLLILDEPTSGLDPLMQQKVLQLFKEVAERGGSVLISSHVLSEVQQICDRIVMIKKGRIILQDTTKNLLEQALKRFRIPHPSAKLTEQLKALPSVKRSQEIPNGLELYVTDNQPVIELLTKNKIYDFYLERPSLEETFLEEYNNH